jgi:centrosomal protein CEP104
LFSIRFFSPYFFDRFKVVHCSSEHDDYPASELNVHSPDTRGWQSADFCDYPQELGFQVIGGDAQISQIQILSHQSKISTKVEIFVGQGSSYSNATFKRLGYLSLDSNERSSYKARELKTVYVDHVGEYIRLLVHRNFVNKYNHYNQVGIVAANFLGTEIVSAGPKSNGSLSVRRDMKGGAPSNSLHDLSIDLNLDGPTAAKLRSLADAKSKAIASEDYKTAKQIKQVENELKDLGAQLAQLDIAKKQAVNAEDYDRAAMLKDETDALRDEIEDKVRDYTSVI